MNMSDDLRNMDVVNIIKAAMADKPVDVETSFNAAIQGKMMAALDAKRDDITQSMYSDTTTNEDNVDVEVENDDLETETTEPENEE